MRSHVGGAIRVVLPARPGRVDELDAEGLGLHVDDRAAARMRTFSLLMPVWSATCLHGLVGYRARVAEVPARLVRLPGRLGRAAR